MSRKTQRSKSAASKKKRAVIIITESKDGSLTVKAQFSPSLEESGNCGILALETLVEIRAKSTA